MVNSLKFYYRNSFITGFFGESLPFDSGLTSVIKGHGHQGPGDIEFQMYSTGEKAILMIRNPYHAIYGYRHYTFHGQLGHADASHFIGKGKWLLTLSKPSVLLEQFKMYGMYQELE